MSSILTQLFLDSLVSLPLPIALNKIRNNEDLGDKNIQIIFIDSVNKEYYEFERGEEQNSLRVVNANLVQDKNNNSCMIRIFVSYEINELIESKPRKKHEN
ncbi:MAG: hypothetical protein ABDH21_02040 [bacterium]